ncbi:MAG: hypothetical protein HY538_05890 [Deltaproteobacteria bacterium]|nr:hypothetical protein [Deltaproteobacteria bacterium]
MKTKSKAKPQFIRPVLFVACIAVALSFGLLLQENSKRGPLFDNIEVPTNLVEPFAKKLSEDPAVKRFRFVTPKMDLFNLEPGKELKGPDLMEVRLFDDVSLQLIKKQERCDSATHCVWIGRAEGTQYNYGIFVINKEKRSITANINRGGKLFQIRSVKSDENLNKIGDNIFHVVKEINQKAYPDDENCQISSGEFKRARSSAAGPSNYILEAEEPIIDVVVFYTQDAADAAWRDIESEIELTVNETNQSYEDSQIQQRVRLIYAGKVDYIESGSSGTDRERLADPSDGFLDEIHTVRNEYGADIVSLWVSNLGDGVCGQAYLMEEVSSEFEAYAFNVVTIDCATGNYSFAHEMGHNMGARHDWYADPDAASKIKHDLHGNIASKVPTQNQQNMKEVPHAKLPGLPEQGPFPYSYGYVTPDFEWRTIMAKTTKDTGCSSDDLCERIPLWSNPHVTFDSGLTFYDHMGVDENDWEGTQGPSENWKTLNNTVSTVSNFRQFIKPQVLFTHSYTIDDTHFGDGDYIPEGGEIIELSLILLADTRGIEYINRLSTAVSSSGRDVSVNNTQPIAFTKTEPDVFVADEPIILEISPSAPYIHQVELELDVLINNTEWLDYSFALIVNPESSIAITTDDFDQEPPAVYGNYVVWVDKRDGFDAVYLYDLSTGGDEVQIARQPRSSQSYSSPDVYDQIIVWDDYTNTNALNEVTY